MYGFAAADSSKWGNCDVESLKLMDGKRREKHYWKCRRALRLCPVGPGDTVDEVKRFMTEHSCLNNAFTESVGPFTAVMVPYGPSARVQDEVIVSFNSTDVRDAVKTSARNLAGKGANCGVRLEFPKHLKSAMKALQEPQYPMR